MERKNSKEIRKVTSTKSLKSVNRYSVKSTLSGTQLREKKEWTNEMNLWKREKWMIDETQDEISLSPNKIRENAVKLQ